MEKFGVKLHLLFFVFALEKVCYVIGVFIFGEKGGEGAAYCSHLNYNITYEVIQMGGIGIYYSSDQRWYLKNSRTVSINMSS